MKDVILIFCIIMKIYIFRIINIFLYKYIFFQFLDKRLLRIKKILIILKKKVGGWVVLKKVLMIEKVYNRYLVEKLEVRYQKFL